MKHLLLVLAACIVALTTNAQWSKKLAGKPKVSKLDYTIDSFRYKGEAVATQRFKITDLNGVLGQDANENRVALALKKLQESFDGAQGAVTGGHPSNMDEERKIIEEIKSQKTDFDLTLLQKEYDFYDKALAKITSDKAMEKQKNQEAAIARDREEQRQRKAKDSTEKVMAAIERAERDSASARRDRELEAAAAKEHARKAAAMTKKYGAAAFAKADAGKLWVGMPEELVEVALGAPSNVNSSTTAEGKQEEWLYYFSNDDMMWRRRVLLRNHAVTAFQVRD